MLRPHPNPEVRSTMRLVSTGPQLLEDPFVVPGQVHPSEQMPEETWQRAEQ